MGQSRSINGNDLRARARNGLLWLGSTTVIWQILNWLLTILTARYLLPGDYGVMALADTVLTYLWIVASLGSNAWLLQNKENHEDVVNQVWSLQLLLGATVTVVGVVIAPGLASFYNSPGLAAPFRLVVFTFFLHSIWGVEETVRQRDLQFRTVAVINLVVTLARGLTQLGLAILGYGVWALVFGIVLREIVAIVCYAPGIRQRSRFSLSRETTRKLLRFGLPLSGSSLLWIVTNTADNITVGRLFGSGALGLYAMAFYLTDLPLSKLNTVVRPVLIPVLVRLRERNASGSIGSSAAMNLAFLRSSQALLLFVAPLLVGLLVVAEEAVDILLGASWRPLIPYLRLMCLVGLFRASVDNVSPMFHALGRPLPQMIHNLISAIVLTTAFIAFGTRWGVIGVFSAWLFVFPFLSVLLLFFLKSVSGISPVAYLSNLLPPIVATVIMAAVAAIAKAIVSESNEAIRLFVAIAAGGGAYAIILLKAYPQVVKQGIQFLTSRSEAEQT